MASGPFADLPARPVRGIRGGRFELLVQRAEHAEEMFALLADPALYAFEGSPPESLEWLRERFARLESTHSPDRRERWLNWVIELPAPVRLAGFVQATVREDASAAIAYGMGSAYWGRGLARQAVATVLAELASYYGVTLFTAIVKRDNVRSRHLLERLAFAADDSRLRVHYAVAEDEILLTRGAA